MLTKKEAAVGADTFVGPNRTVWSNRSMLKRLAAAKRLNLTPAAMKTRLRRARLAVRANVLQRQAKTSGAIA